MTPDQIELAEARRTKIREAFRGLDEPNEALDRAAAQTAEPRASKARMANMAYLASRTGEPLNKIAKVWDQERPLQAKKLFGAVDDPGDEGFYTHVAAEYNREDGVREESNKTAQAAANRAILSQFAESNETGEVFSVPWAQEYEAYRKERTPPSYQDAKAEEVYRQTFRNTYERGAAESVETKQVANDLLAQLEIKEGLETGGAITQVKPEVFEKLKLMDEDSRSRVYAFMQANVDLNKIPDDWAANTSKAFQRGFKNSYGNIGLNEIEMRVGNIDGAEDDQITLSRATDVTDKLGDRGLLMRATVVDGAIGGFFKNLGLTEAQATPQEIEQIRRASDEAKRDLDIARELRGLRQGVVNPVKEDNFLAKKAWYPALEQVGFMSLAATTAGLPALVASTSESRFTEMRDRGLSRDQARDLSVISAIIEAPIERMQVKTLVGGRFGAAMTAVQTKLAAKLGIVGSNVAAQLITQNAQEAVQDIMPLLVQETAASLSEQFPKVDWDKELAKYGSQRVDTFWALLPMAVLGAGVGSAKDYREAQSYLSDVDRLEGLGVDRTEAETIATLAKEDPVKAGEAFQKAEKTEVEVPAFDAESAKLEDLLNSPDLPTITTLEEGRVDVEFDDGSSVSVGTVQEAQQVVQDFNVDRANKARDAVGELIDSFRSKGTEINVEDRVKTLGDFVDEGVISPEQARQRIHDLSAETGLEFGDNAFSRVRVYAQNEAEFRDGVFRNSVRLFGAENPVAVVEDVSEGFFKQWIAGGERAKFEQWLGDYQQATGDTLVPEIQTASDASLVEGLSSLATSYFAGNVQDSSLSSGIKSLFRQLATYFQYLFDRAGRLNDAFKDGKLDPEFESRLAESVGLDFDQTEAMLVEKAKEKSLRELIAETRRGGLQVTTQEKFTTKGGTVITPNEDTKVAPGDDATSIGPATFSIRAFHGSTSDFTKFDLKHQGSATDAGWWGWGLYFSPEEQIAEIYLRNSELTGGLYEVELRVDRGELYNADERYGNQPDFVKSSIEQLEEDAKDDGLEIDYSELDSTVFEQLNEFFSGGDSNQSSRDASIALLEYGVKGVLAAKGAEIVVFSEKFVEITNKSPTEAFNRFVDDIFDESFDPREAVNEIRGSVRIVDLGGDFTISGVTYPRNSPVGLDIQGVLARVNGETRSLFVDAVSIKVSSLNEDKKLAGEFGDATTDIENRMALLKTVTVDNLGGVEFEQTLSAPTFSVASEDLEAKLTEFFNPPDFRTDQIEKALGRIRKIEERFRKLQRQAGLNASIVQRVDIQESVAQLEGILSVLPVQVRSKIKGFSKIASIHTDRGRLTFFKDRIDRTMKVLDEFIAKENVAKFDKLLKRSLPKKVNGKLKSFLTPELAETLVQIAEVREMSTERVDTFITGMQESVVEPDKVASASELVWLAETFGALDSADAFQSEQALDELREMIDSGRNRYKIAQEQFRNQIDANITVAQEEADLDVDPDSVDVADAERAERTGLKKLAAGIKGFAVDHLSWRQMLVTVFGYGKTSDHFEKLANDAKNDFTDSTLRRRTEMRDWMVTDLGLTTGRSQMAWLVDLKRVKEDSGVETSNGKAMALSQDEALYYTMLWDQPNYRKNLETHDGIDAKTVEQMENFLTPEARQYRAYLQENYEKEYDRINAVYRELNGVDMPRVTAYAPASVKMGAGKDLQLDPLGQDHLSTGLSAGFTKMRTAHNLPMNRQGASIVYWAHAQATDYYVSHAEAAREMRLTLLNDKVVDGIKLRKGRARAKTLAAWVEQFHNKGLRKASAALAAEAWTQRMIKTTALVGLAYNTLTLAKQTSAVLGSLAEIPVVDWVRGAVKMLYNRQAYKDIWNTPTIQRRINNGFSVEMQTAMSASHATPSQIIWMMEKGLPMIGFVDAAWTTFSAGIAYDYHLREAKKLMPEAEAKEFALAKMDIIVARTAQPAANTDRSIMEISMDANVLGKLYTLFKSEMRQKVAITMMGVRDVVKQEGNAMNGARAATVAWILMPMITKMMEEMYTMLFRDHEDEDLWSLTDMANTITAGQSAGILWFGEALEAASKTMWGEKVWSSDDNASVKAVATAFQTFDKIADGEFGDEDLMGDINRVSRAISMAIGGRAAALGVTTRVIKETVGAIDNGLSLVSTPDPLEVTLRELEAEQDAADEAKPEPEKKEKLPKEQRRVKALRVGTLKEPGPRVRGVKALLDATPEAERESLRQDLIEAKILSTTVQKQLKKLDNATS